MIPYITLGCCTVLLWENEGVSNENVKKVHKETEVLLCAAVGTASHQHGLEACTVCGDPTVCSCRHSK